MAIANIFAKARETPDKIAVVHDGVAYTYAEFARAIEKRRRQFAAEPLSPGSLAVICADSLLEGWVSLLALRCLGLSTISVRSAAEIGQLRLSNVGLVVISADEPPQAERTLEGFGVRIARVAPDLRDTAASTDIPATPEMAARTTGHIAGHILLTSGTTGENKKVLRDAATEALAMPQLAATYGIGERSIVYIARFPLWTAGGYRWPLMTWTVGATAVLHQGADQHQPLFAHSMTHIFATPSSLAAMMGGSKGVIRRNDATRLLVTGGAMSKAMWVAAKQHVSRQVVSVLASTEASAVSFTPIEQEDDLLWHRIDPSREVQVVDERGTVLPLGEEGHVRIRIDDGLEGYLDDPIATREYFRDGYFYPGDLGLFGADGRLSLRGRASDVVNVLGLKVATGAIERVLQDRWGAEGVCILSIPGDEGDEIHLLIQAGRKIERAEIETVADAELGDIKRVPVRISFVATMPRNDMGKIDRRVLKEELLQRRAAAPSFARGNAS